MNFLRADHWNLLLPCINTASPELLKVCGLNGLCHFLAYSKLEAVSVSASVSMVKVAEPDVRSYFQFTLRLVRVTPFYTAPSTWLALVGFQISPNLFRSKKPLKSSAKQGPHNWWGLILLQAFGLFSSLYYSFLKTTSISLSVSNHRCTFPRCCHMQSPVRSRASPGRLNGWKMPPPGPSVEDVSQVHWCVRDYFTMWSWSLDYSWVSGSFLVFPLVPSGINSTVLSDLATLKSVPSPRH